jgi:hypothetical protein
MIGRCATCRHWGERNDWSFGDWENRAEERICSLTETYRSGVLVDGELVHDEARLAVAVGGEACVLVTKPDFGCVQWEASS